MAQGSGYMNTAPPPIPGGYGNPTGANNGLPKVNPAGLPPSFGTLPTTASPTTTLPQSLTATPGTSAFPANGVTSPTDFGKLNSGMGAGVPPQDQKNLLTEFQRAYGRGTGQLLFDMISKGLFNPQVAQAMINAMQPMEARGRNNVTNAFGAEGARFSSAAAIGLGDFESQFALNEQQVLAGLFQHDQDLQVSLLENTLPTLHKEQANQSGGWLHYLMGALETAAGVALEFVPGGQVIGTGLISGGVGTLAGGSGSPSSPSSPSSSSNGGGGIQDIINLIKGPGGTNSLGPPGSTPIDQGTFNNIIGAPVPGTAGISDGSGSLSDLARESSAASSITGSTNNSNTNLDPQQEQLLKLLQELGIDPSMFYALKGGN